MRLNFLFTRAVARVQGGRALVTAALLLLVGAKTVAAGNGGVLSIAGTITGEDDGQPTGLRQVLLYDQNSQFVGSDFSQPDGTYALTEISEGSYWVRTKNLDRTDLHLDETHAGALCPFGGCPTPAPGELVVLDGTAPVTTLDFQLPLGGNITGVVSDPSGAALTSAAVTLRDDAGNSLGYELMHSGSYAFYAFPPGTYHAAASVPLSDWIPEAWDDIVCYPSTCDEGATTEIVVTAGASVAIDFQLELGGAISGVFVTDDNTPNPGTPISGQVTVWTEQGDFLLNTNASGGVYRIGGLASGTYFVRGTNSSGYFNEIYDDILWGHGHSAAITDGTPVLVVAPQGTSGIDFRLPSGASISGRVTDALTGAGLESFFIRAIRQDVPNAPVSLSSLQALEGSEGGAVRESPPISSWADGDHAPTPGHLLPVRKPRAAQSPGGSERPRAAGDADRKNALAGEYQIIPLDAGTYEVSASSQDDSYLSATWPELLTLGVNETATGIDFALVPTAKISGRVTDLAGNPIPGAGVGWRTLDPNDTSFDNFEVAPDGSFTMTGIPARNDYYVIAWAPGHVPELYPDLVCHFVNCDFASATLIALDPGDEATGVDFALGPAVTIDATVTTVADGSPIANVGLRVFDSNGLYVTSRGTDAAGHAVIDTLLPGQSYYLAVGFAVGYYFELWNDHPFSYVTDFTVPYPEVLTGDLLDFSSGASLISVAMDLDDENTAPELSAEVFSQLGGGGVLSAGGGFLSCDETGGVVCLTRAFPTGSTTTLVVTADPGSTFVGFGGDDDCLDGEITLDGDRHCTATFEGDPLIFADGFESGNLADWSAANP